MKIPLILYSPTTIMITALIAINCFYYLQPNTASQQLLLISLFVGTSMAAMIRCAWLWQQQLAQLYRKNK